MTKITSFLMVLLMVPAAFFAQSVITVDNSVGSSAQYSDLQTAIDNASSGDIIYVHPTEITYGGFITLDKSLTLIGYSHSDPEKKTTVNSIDIEGDLSNVTIKGFHFTSYLEVSNNTVGLQNLVLENNRFDGITYFGGTNTNNLIIRGNVIDQIGTGTSSWVNYTNAIITNNIITGNVFVLNHESVQIENNIFISNGTARPINSGNATGNLIVQDCILYKDSGSNFEPNSDGVVYENCLSYNPTTTVTALAGSNNINDQDPLFVLNDNNFFNFEDDFNLQVGSPALGTGVNGDDIGLFGGNGFMFSNSGFSTGIPIVNITAITSQVAPGGNVEVTIESSSN